MWDLIMASGGFFVQIHWRYVRRLSSLSTRILPLNPCVSRRTLRPPLAIASTISPAVADSTGHFGPFGGMFIPETLTLD